MRTQGSSQGEIISEDQLSAVKHKNKHTFGGPTTKQYAPKHFIISCQLADEFQEEHLSNAHNAKERLTCAKIETFAATVGLLESQPTGLHNRTTSQPTIQKLA